jgi:hypothetical protein
MADFDPARFFLLGQESRLKEEQLKMQRLKRSQLEQIPGARAEYFAGDPTALRGLDPQEWSNLETQRMQRVSIQQAAEKNQLDMVEAYRKKQLNNSKAVLGTLAMAQRDPSKWSSVVSTLEQIGAVQPGSLNPNDPPPRAQIEDFLNQQKMTVASLDSPKLSNDVTELLQAMGYAGQEAFGLQDPKVQQKIDELVDSKSKARGKANTVVNVNASDLTAGMQKQMQQDVVEASDTLRRLNIIKMAATDPVTGEADFGNYLGYGSNAKGKWLNFRDKLPSWIDWTKPSESDRQWLSKYNVVRASVMAMRAEEFHRLIGGAQTPVEIENLVDSFLNMDMSPEQFKVVFNQIMATTQDLIDARREVLKNGIKYATAEYDQAVDKLAVPRIKARLAKIRMAASGEPDFSGIKPLPVGG